MGLWPDLSRCRRPAVVWLLPLYARNLLAVCALYGGMHYWLYTAKQGRRRFCPALPPPQQHERDRKFTLRSSCISATYEAAYILLLANGMVPHYLDIRSNAWWGIVG